MIQDRFTQPLLVFETERERAGKSVQKVFTQKIRQNGLNICGKKVYSKSEEKVFKSVQKLSKNVLYRRLGVNQCLGFLN